MTLVSMLGLALLTLATLAWFTPDIADWTARKLQTRAAGLRAARQAQGHVWEIHRGLERARRNGRG